MQFVRIAVIQAMPHPYAIIYEYKLFLRETPDVYRKIPKLNAKYLY